MRLSVKTGSVILCCLSVSLFISCVTPGAPEKTPAVTEKPTMPKYTRIGFGEKLEKLITEQKYDQAIALFDTVPEPDASDLSIRMLKLSILISAGKTAESVALANELEALNPENPEILYIQAVLSGARNDVTGRTNYLNKVLTVQPTNSEALTGLGLDLLDRKNYPQAKLMLIKAVASDPENTEALLGLARVYYMQEDLGKAGDALNLAIGKNPGNSELWAERARIKSETDDLNGAIEDIKKSVELDPTIYGSWIDYGNYLISLARKPEARKAFTEAIKIDPDHYLAYIYRAGLNDDLGNLDEAIADYQAICRLYPQYYYASESLGILLWGKGDYEGSRAAFLDALTYSPKSTSYALMMTLCYYRESKPAEAKAFMAKYITTLDRTSIDYLVCRLFVDRSGDADVLSRIMKVENANSRNRLLFYSAMYYDLFQSKTIAQKYLIEVTSIHAPNFFEYRLSQWALKDLEKSEDKTSQG